MGSKTIVGIFLALIGAILCILGFRARHKIVPAIKRFASDVKEEAKRMETEEAATVQAGQESQAS